MAKKKKSTTQRLIHAESICVGAGFLLKKLQARYGSDFGEGMHIQVADCIRDCTRIETARKQREAFDKAMADRAGTVQ